MKTLESPARKSAAKKPRPANPPPPPRFREKPSPKEAPSRKKTARPTLCAPRDASAPRSAKTGENGVLLRIADVSIVADYMVLCSVLKNPICTRSPTKSPSSCASKRRPSPPTARRSPTAFWIDL
jgi:hypothetical protein